MPAPDWQSLYPFQQHFLDLDGARLHYLDEGRGQPLVLVHGNPTWSFYWRNVVLGLRDEFRLIVPDHIGCGLSDKPQAYEYRLANHVENLVRLIEELDLRGATLVGHDWGGAIGMGAAARTPDRFARIVLMNTAAFLSRRIPLRIRLCRTPLVGPLLIRGLNLFLRAALRSATEKPELFTPAVRAGYLAPYDNWRNRVAILRFVQDIPLGRRHPTRRTLGQIETALPQFRGRPLLLMWGLKDWCFTPHFLRRFQQEFPQAETEEIAGAGHLIVEDSTDRVVARLRRFLHESGPHAPREERSSRGA
jgi:haloalkane dehalogenase